MWSSVAPWKIIYLPDKVMTRQARGLSPGGEWKTTFLILSIIPERQKYQQKSLEAAKQFMIDRAPHHQHTHLARPLSWKNQSTLSVSIHDFQMAIIVNPSTNQERWIVLNLHCNSATTPRPYRRYSDLPSLWSLDTLHSDNFPIKWTKCGRYRSSTHTLVCGILDCAPNRGLMIY